MNEWVAPPVAGHLSTGRQPQWLVPGLAKTTFGVNLESWTTLDKFRDLRLNPESFHFRCKEPIMGVSSQEREVKEDPDGDGCSR